MFETLITTKIIGKNLVYMPTCHSTNAIAIERLKNEHAKEGDVVVTDWQTAGKGQRGNQWLTEPSKNLTFSIVLNVSLLNVTQIFNLNMAVCLALIKVLKEVEIDKSEFYSVKWPNDLYFSDKKLGGILIETILKADQTLWAVVGIGLNVNQTEFGRLNATSLKNNHNIDFQLDTLLEKIVLEIEFFIYSPELLDFKTLKALFLKCLFKYNTTCHFRRTNGEHFEGKIKDIDQTGKIAIEVEGKISLFDKQEIQFLR